MPGLCYTLITVRGGNHTGKKKEEETNMMNKGKLVTEWGEVVGYYWYRPSTWSYALCLYGRVYNGYTEEGINEVALRLGCWVEEEG